MMEGSEQANLRSEECPDWDVREPSHPGCYRKVLQLPI